jgi:hypothetical protein
VAFPDHLKKIDSYAFRDTGITGISFKTGPYPLDLRDYSFDCKQLTGTVAFPANLVLINYSFQNTKIKHLTFADGAGIKVTDDSGNKVTPALTIANYAFSGVTTLTGTIVFPDHLEKISGGPFQQTGLSKVIFKPGPHDLVLEGYAFYGNQLSGNVTLPPNLVRLQHGSFAETNITSATFTGPSGTNLTGDVFTFPTGTKIYTPCGSLASYDNNGKSGNDTADGKWYGYDLVDNVSLTFYHEEAAKIATMSGIACNDEITTEDLPATAAETATTVNFGGWYSDDGRFLDKVAIPGTPFSTTNNTILTDLTIYPKWLNYGSVESTIVTRILPTIMITTEDREEDGGVADGLDDGIIFTDDLIPDEEGVTQTVNDYVIVTTNSLKGYRLSLKAKSTTEMLYAPDPFDQSTYNNSYTIPTLTNASLTTPTDLNIDLGGGKNAVWGYNLPHKFPVGKYNGVTLTDVTIKETTAPANRDYTTVTYGVKANAAQAAGTYAGVVIYTAVALE